VTSRVWEIPLPWSSPPITLNTSFGNRYAKARAVRTVRNTACLLARNHRIPPLAACSVQLTYEPRDSRRRDADNLVGLLKPLCDGLVDGGVVGDDTPELMAKPTPVILPANSAATVRLRLVVTELEASA